MSAGIYNVFASHSSIPTHISLYVLSAGIG